MSPLALGSRAHTPQEVGRGSAASHALDSKQIKHIRPVACVGLCYRLGGVTHRPYRQIFGWGMIEAGRTHRRKLDEVPPRHLLRPLTWVGLCYRLGGDKLSD